MKKLIILVAAVLTMASCGNKTNQNAENIDSTVVTSETDIEATADSITTELDKQLSSSDAKSFETTLSAAQAKYEELVKAGKAEEAAAYASKLKAYYDKNAETIKKVASGNTTINELINGIVNLPNSVEQGASDAKDAAVSDANAAAQGAVDAVNATKDAATQTVKDAKNAAKQTVKDAEKKVKDDVKSAKENAKKQASDAANKAVNNALNKAFGN